MKMKTHQRINLRKISMIPGHARETDTKAKVNSSRTLYANPVIEILFG